MNISRKTTAHYVSLWCTLISLALLSCTEQIPSPNTATQPLTARASISPTSIWSPTATIGTETLPSPQGELNTLGLALTSNHSAFTYWQASLPGMMPIVNSMVMQRDTDAVSWTLNSPFTDSGLAIRALQLHSHQFTDIAFMTWTTMPGDTYLARFDPAIGWQAIGSLGANLNDYRLLFDTTGDLSIIWQTTATNGTVELHTRRYLTDQGLTTMSTLIRGTANTPQLFSISELTGAIDNTGMLQLVWLEQQQPLNPLLEPTTAQLWWTHYSPTTGWTTPESIDTISLDRGLPPNMKTFQLALDPNTNNAVLVFSFFMPDIVNNTGIIYSAAYTEGTWSSITSVDETSPGMFFGGNIAISDNGHIAAVWVKNEAQQDTTTTLYAKQYAPDAGWSNVSQITQHITTPPQRFSQADIPQIDINNQGETVIVWGDPTQTQRQFLANHFAPATGWAGQEVAVTTSVANDLVRGHQVKIASNGKATLIWHEQSNDGANTVYTIQASDHSIVASAASTSSTSSIPALSTTTAKSINNNWTLAHPLANSGFILPLVTATTHADIQTKNTANLWKIDNAWDTPQAMGVTSLPIDQPSYFVGPIVQGDNQGAAFVYWSSGLQDTPDTAQATLLRRNTINAEWQTSTPLPTTELANTSFRGIYTDAPTGIAYALWNGCTPTDCNDVYVSRFDPSLDPAPGWMPPTMIGTGLCCGALYLDANANVTAIWQALPNANGTLDYIARSYDIDNGWGEPTTLVNTIVTAPTNTINHINNRYFAFGGSTNASGNILFVWNTVDAGQDNQYISAEYHPQTGWSTPNPLPITLGTPLTQPVFALSTHWTENTSEIVLLNRIETADTPQETLIAFDYTNGTWSNEQNIGDTDTLYSLRSEIFSSATNIQGEMIIAWKKLSADNQIKLNVSHYSPNTGWSGPIPIADPESIVTMTEPPLGADQIKVVLNDNGEAAAAWTNYATDTLLVSHYSPNAGWNPSELVVKTNNTTTEYIGNIDIHLDEQNRTTVVWDQVINTGTNWEHHTYTSVHLGDNGPPSPSPSPDPIPDPVPDPIPDPVTTPSEWTPQTVAWEQPFPALNDAYIMPPQLIASSNDTLWLSIQTLTQLDPDPITFAGSNNSLWSNTGNNQTWEINAPSAIAATDQYQSVFNPLIDIVVTAWLVEQTVFISTKRPSTSWTEPQSVTTDASDFILLSPANGAMVLAWQTNTNSLSINASTIIIQADGSYELTPPANITLPNGNPAAPPVIDAIGRVSLLWRSPDGLQFIRLLPDSGWQAPSTNLTTTDMDQSFTLISPSADDTLLVISRQLSTRHLYATRFAPSTGWSAEENIDANADTPNAVMGLVKIATNSAGEVMVLWVEETHTTDNNFIHQIFTTRYQAQPDADGKYWTSPQLVAETDHLNHDETPQLFLAEDGKAVATWVTNRRSITTLYASKYYPATGWLATPDTISQVIGLTISPKSQPAAIISPTGKITIIWHEQRLETSDDVIYFSQNQM